jgi:hypothetical protein
VINDFAKILQPIKNCDRFKTMFGAKEFSFFEILKN